MVACISATLGEHACILDAFEPISIRKLRKRRREKTIENACESHHVARNWSFSILHHSKSFRLSWLLCTHQVGAVKYAHWKCIKHRRYRKPFGCGPILANPVARPAKSMPVSSVCISMSISFACFSLVNIYETIQVNISNDAQQISGIFIKNIIKSSPAELCKQIKVRTFCSVLWSYVVCYMFWFSFPFQLLNNECLV